MGVETKIGGKIFKSKTDAINYVKLKLKGMDGIYPMITTDYIFLDELLDNHPDNNTDRDKRAIGISHFKVKPNIATPDGKHVSIYNVDGTTNDFSWRSCCGFKKSQYTHDSELFRSAIIDLMVNIKHNKKCECCGSEHDLHAHHHGLTFKNIVDTFIKNPENIPHGYKKISMTQNTFIDEDNDIKLRFIEYHNSRCDLRILCKPCHRDVHNNIIILK